MSAVQSGSVVAAISSEQKEAEIAVQQKIEEDEITADSQSDGEEEEEEKINWEAEEDESENYCPEGIEEEEEDEDSCSSGEEEIGVDVGIVEHCGQKFFKLKYEEIEQKRKALKEKMQAEEEEGSDAELEEEQNEEKTEESEKKETVKDSFKEYRTATILDEDMDKEYKSDEDEFFDPMNCECTLTDIEYSEGDERDTESEPETEPIDGQHKKTGETLRCIKMIEQLQIPPRDQPCLSGEFAAVKPSDQPMECS